MKRIAGCLAIWMTAVCLSPAFAQEAEDRTLLSWAEMRHIINGERLWPGRRSGQGGIHA